MRKKLNQETHRTKKKHKTDNVNIKTKHTKVTLNKIEPTKIIIRRQNIEIYKAKSQKQKSLYKKTYKNKSPMHKATIQKVKKTQPMNPKETNRRPRKTKPNKHK